MFKGFTIIALCLYDTLIKSSSLIVIKVTDRLNTFDFGETKCPNKPMIKTLLLSNYIITTILVLFSYHVLAYFSAYFKHCVRRLKLIASI